MAVEPAQEVVDMVEILGVGSGVTVIVAVELAWQLLLFVTVTVYVPAAVMLIAAALAALDQR